MKKKLNGKTWKALGYDELLALAHMHIAKYQQINNARAWCGNKATERKMKAGMKRHLKQAEQLVDEANLLIN